MLKSFIRALTLGGAVFFASQSQAATVVLVHGAFQDASVWQQVTPLLEKQGHKVILVDLPGRKSNPADPFAQTLAAYRDAVLKVTGEGPDKVVLVGHSFGGFTISAVAEAIPARIDTAIYVAAYLPQSGEAMKALAAQDKGSKFTQENFVVAKDYSTATVLERDRGLIFCEECSDDQKKVLLAGMVDEPLKPVAEPITLTEAAFGSVRKAYIATKRDNAVSRSLQQMMIDRAKLSSVIEIDTGHAPAISAPQALADAINASIGMSPRI
jgi:pimeloyl-ACP methyl ester carboxylesterase